MKNYKLYIVAIPLLIISLSCKKELKADDDTKETQAPELVSNAVKVNDHLLGFYSALPGRYLQTSKKYPLLIWIHGNGQVGNGRTDLPKVLYGGVPKLLNEKLFPPDFRVQGNSFSFIILAPQFTQWPGNDDVMSLITYAKKNYRVDVSRIYLSGLSMGGIVTADVAAGYGSQLAAVVPIAGVSIGNGLTEKCASIAHANLPVWVFQNSNDDVFDLHNSLSFVSLINGFKSSVPARYTEFLPFGDNGHDAWTKATDPNYKENTINIYEWMLQYSNKN
jgi:predicted peptidase